ncbi:MAG: hypothetical protein L3J78_02705 [Thermoplasmata archaeon]|nr:hypothetical protein [Thermoplasmata archaeon]
MLFLATLTLGVVASILVLPVSADVPKVTQNSDLSRNVTWLMKTAASLNLSGLDLANGSVTLPWTPSGFAWPTGSDFATHGRLDANLTVAGAGITLRSDPSNHVSNGDFATGASWTFNSSPRGNVSAQRNASAQVAMFRHDSASTEVLFDSLDSIGGWVGVPAGNTIWVSTSGQLQGAGMVGLNFSLGSSPGLSAGLLHYLSTVNWSQVDRMVISIRPLDVSSPLTFNVTALIGGTLHTTVAQPLRAGWQELTVNLTQLGPARDALASLTLRLNGRNAGPTTVFFDDLRVGNRKQFNETGWVRQQLWKPNATSAAIGSAVLRFNWTLPRATGIVRATGLVNVSGGSVSSATRFGTPIGAAWRSFEVDVSKVTTAAGWYNASLGLEVVVDNTSASSVETRADDVSFVFPNRHNGTYLSKAVLLDAASEFLGVGWTADVPAQTAARMALRSGNKTNPTTFSWGPWQTWTGTGTYPVAIAPATYVQVRAILETSNSSAAPAVSGMTLQTRHRASTGVIRSDSFNVPVNPTASPIRWQLLNSSGPRPAGTSINFSVGDGTYLQSVPPDGNLSSLRLTTIRWWSATLATSNGLFTPSLLSVTLVYDYVAPVPPGAWFDASNVYQMAGLAVLSAAGLGYVAYSFGIRRRFAIDDVFLIAKDGRLLMHNTRRMRADRDEDILSGMLTAIVAFLRDSDPEENGDLRRFEIGGKTTLVERGPHAYLAAVYSGPVPRWAGKDLRRFMSNLEETFGTAFASWSGSPEDLQGLKEFTGRFVSRMRYRPPRGANGRAA